MKDELIEILNFKYLKKGWDGSEDSLPPKRITIADAIKIMKRWNISKLGEPIVDASYDGSISFFVFNKNDGSVKYSIDLLPDRRTVVVIMNNNFSRIYPKTYVTSMSHNKIDLIFKDIIENL